MAAASAAMVESLIRFVPGGAVVSIFALTADILRPKSFAGLFGAAPSVALVSLALAIVEHGQADLSVEAVSMIAGAAALLAFSVVTCHLIKRWGLSALPATLLACPVWLLVAFSLHAMVE